MRLGSVPTISPWYRCRRTTRSKRIWLYVRERFLSLRFPPDTEAIIEACCRAWNARSGRFSSRATLMSVAVSYMAAVARQVAAVDFHTTP
jgi:hypothetical protein